MIDDLPDDLAALVSAERGATPSPEVRSSVRAKLAASAVVAGAATVSSSSAAAAGKAVVAGTGIATKVAVAVALIAGGTTAALVLRREPAPTSPPPTSSTQRAPAASTRGALPVVQSPDPAEAPPPIAPASPPLAPPASSSQRERVRSVEPARAQSPIAEAAPPPVSPRPSEAETVAEAWRTLPNDPQAALSEVEAISGGTLVEEREAIRCLALARLKRPEAADAIAQFLSAHPRSVHRALVERAQKGLP